MSTPFLELLTVIEHKESSYPPRTRHNAGTADLTAAFAFDFDTLGERLTKTAANGKYVDIHLSMEPLAAARKMFSAWRYFEGTVLNVAGNSIETLNHRDWSQSDANRYLFFVLKTVHEHRIIKKVISGGQTGIDLAGAVAAIALGIPAEMTLPKGYRQRHIGREAKSQTKEQIVEQVAQGVAELLNTDPEHALPAKVRP